MKNKVIQWLRDGSNFQEGLSILPREGVLDNLARLCSLQGETKSNKEMLEYQLCKYVGIHEKEALKFKSKKTTAAAPKIKITIDADQLKVKKHTIVKESINVVPKLRDEFPFLNAKDCPDELKILVADKITSYKKYVDTRAKIDNGEFNNETELFNLSKESVDSYIENQLIYKELNHYAKTGKLLMKHPIFKERKRDTEIKKLSLPELIKLKKNIEMNVWRNETKIKEDPKSSETQNRLERVKSYKRELTLVNNMLGVNE